MVPSCRTGHPRESEQGAPGEGGRPWAIIPSGAAQGDLSDGPSALDNASVAPARKGRTMTIPPLKSIAITPAAEKGSSADGVAWDLRDLYASVADPRITQDLESALARARTF